jgi:phosphatidate cytidylyltransferase
MLKTRIITASILLLVFFSGLFYLPPPGWAAFSTLIAALSVWEWGGLMRARLAVRLLLVLGLLFFCVSLAVFSPEALGLASGFHQQAWVLGRWFYIPALILWIVVVPLWMHFRWDMTSMSIGILVGAVLILPTWLALVQLRSAGSAFLLGIMACVWIADTGAYLFGRLLGKHKREDVGRSLGRRFDGDSLRHDRKPEQP